MNFDTDIQIVKDAKGKVLLHRSVYKDESGRYHRTVEQVVEDQRLIKVMAIVGLASVCFLVGWLGYQAMTSDNNQAMEMIRDVECV